MTETVDDGDAYKKAKAALERLPLSRPWSIDRFVAEVGFQLGRLIKIEDLPASLSDSGEISGVWIPTALVDVVLVKRGAAGSYREHIVCHEIAHIVMAHQTDSTALNTLLHETFARVAPNISSEMIERLANTQFCFTRADFLHPMEREAEWLATLIMAAADELRQPLYPGTADVRDQEMLRRAAKVFGWPI